MFENGRLSLEIRNLAGGNLAIGIFLLANAVDILETRSGVDGTKLLSSMISRIELQLGETLPKPVPEGYWDDLRIRKLIGNSNNEIEVK